MKLLFPTQNYNVLSPSSYTHISVRDSYISKTGLPTLLQGNMWTDPGNILIAHRHMNVEFGAEAVQFPVKDYIKGIFLAVHLRGVAITYPSELRHPRDEHAGWEPEGVAVSPAVGELDDLRVDDECPAQLRQVHRQRGETAAALTRLTLRRAN